MQSNLSQNSIHIQELEKLMLAYCPSPDTFNIHIGCAAGSEISILIYRCIGNIAEPSARKFYYNQEIDDAELSTALVEINMRANEISEIEEMLEKTGMDWISTTDRLEHPLELYLTQEPRKSFESFLIYPVNFNREKVEESGIKPIGTDDFQSRVYMKSYD
jgi:hypothetical protein